jgi:hypothetical protein
MTTAATPAPKVETLPLAADQHPMPSLPRASRQPRPDSHVLALEELRIHGLERAVVLGTGLLVAATFAWAALTHVPEISRRRLHRRLFSISKAGSSRRCWFTKATLLKPASPCCA